ncbi:hypothetical protein RSAG8_10823, partial [Rhizoctonia solani AG-8 WAC10335]
MAIKSMIGGKTIIIDVLNRRLKEAANMEDEEDAEMEQQAVRPLLDQENKAFKDLQKFLTNVTREWEDPEKRVIGHVVRSPAISLNVGDDGFTQDWAVVEIYPSMIDKSNFVGNVIDLGTSIAADKLTGYMYRRLANPTSFKYPANRLLELKGTIPDKNMFKPDPRTLDQENDPVIMVLKHGSATGLTVGHLNSIRSATRKYFEGKPGAMSKEVAVTPRNSKSGPFSERGDSGSVVVSGTGQVAGIITGGAGVTDVSDCTYVTSINFIIKSLAAHGFNANIFPTGVNL